MKCDKCGGTMKHRDFVKRLVKTGGNNKQWINVERMICLNCNHIQRVLPPELTKYRHYSINVVDSVCNNDVPLDIRYEDYPCDTTIKRWTRERSYS